MMIRVLPEADGEVIAAAEWYDGRERGLGDEFLAEVHRVYDAISALPDTGSPLEFYSGNHRIRRSLLRRFPYAVVFLVREAESLVVAVAHTHRRPLYWLE